jgi:hypothetical protein
VDLERPVENGAGATVVTSGGSGIAWLRPVAGSHTQSSWGMRRRRRPSRDARGTPPVVTGDPAHPAGVHRVHVSRAAEAAHADQAAAQERRDEAAVGVAEAEAEAGRVVLREAAARFGARRGAAHEGGRVGARRDRQQDVERERRRLVPRRPPRAPLRPRLGDVAAAAVRHGWIYELISPVAQRWSWGLLVYARYSRD